MNKMRGFIGLTKRNLLVFFKDKQTIVFSLLTSIIVLVLYLLFLKGTFVDSMNSVMNEYGLASLIDADEINMFANLFLLTGILGSAMITVPYNCLTTLVKDKENKVDYDILATPIKRGQIIMSYFISAALSSVLLTGIILALGLSVICMQGKIYMDPLQLLEAFGVVALGSVSATALFMIIVMFFKSTGASGAFFGMLAAASGFVIGAYIPISQFSESVQSVCNIFPASHITIMLRNALMNGILDHMDLSIGGLDNGMFVSSMKDIFTFKSNMFGKLFDVSQMLVYVIVLIIFCLLVQIGIFARNYKKR